MQEEHFFLHQAFFAATNFSIKLGFLVWQGIFPIRFHP